MSKFTPLTARSFDRRLAESYGRVTETKQYDDSRNGPCALPTARVTAIERPVVGLTTISCAISSLLDITRTG